MGRMKDQDFKRIKESIPTEDRFLCRESIFTKNLVDHAEAIEAELQEAVDKNRQAGRTIGSINGNVVRLQTENDRKGRILSGIRDALGSHLSNNLDDQVKGLVSEVEALRIQNAKVAMPQDVAEAIRSFRDEGRDNDYIIRCLSYRNYAPTDRLRKLLDYAAKHGHQLIAALVNGYTVEEPPTTEDKITASLTQALEDMQVQSPVTVERLAKVLTHAIREVLAEDRQEEE